MRGSTGIEISSHCSASRDQGPAASMTWSQSISSSSRMTDSTRPLSRRTPRATPGRTVAPFFRAASARACVYSRLLRVAFPNSLTPPMTLSDRRGSALSNSLGCSHSPEKPSILASSKRFIDSWRAGISSSVKATLVSDTMRLWKSIPVSLRNGPHNSLCSLNDVMASSDRGPGMQEPSRGLSPPAENPEAWELIPSRSIMVALTPASDRK